MIKIVRTPTSESYTISLKTFFEARCDALLDASFLESTGSVNYCYYSTTNTESANPQRSGSARCQTAMEVADACYFYTIGKSCRNVNIV